MVWIIITPSYPRIGQRQQGWASHFRRILLLSVCRPHIKGVLPVQHDVQHDATRPDVGQLAVVCPVSPVPLLDHLRGHVCSTGGTACAHWDSATCLQYSTGGTNVLILGFSRTLAYPIQPDHIGWHV